MKNPSLPKFKKYDRYKANGYRAYNWKMPAIYDQCIWMKILSISNWDQFIISEIDKNISLSRILDVGCATGRILFKLGSKGAKNLSGTDIAPNIIEVARQKLQRISIKADLRITDAEDNLPWAKNSFDYVILSGVIHHFYRPGDALKEIYRILDKNGKLIIIDPWFPIIIRQMLNLWLLFFPHDGDYHFYTPSQIIRLISKTGISHACYKRAGAFSYLVTGYKK